jgi:DNA-binding NtrC family response regulator
MAKILLVEPDIKLGKIYCQYLEMQGHKIVWRTTAQSALIQVDEFGPDVNVGNAHPGDVSELETIRRGIYYDPGWPYIRWLKQNRPTKNWWEVDMPDYDIDIEPRPVWKYSGEETVGSPKEAVPVNRKKHQ